MSAQDTTAAQTTNTGKPSDPYTEANLDKDIPLKEKVHDLVAFIEKCKFCMMATRIASSGLIVSRCMSLAAKEHNGIDMIFHANATSGKLDDLHSDPDINLGFLNSHGEWASISGKASIITDRAEIQKHYSPSLKAWLGDLEDGVHDGGPTDPRLCLIKVQTITAQYSISRKGILGSAYELAKGIAHDKVPKINKMRHLDEAEIQQWRNQ